MKKTFLLIFLLFSFQNGFGQLFQRKNAHQGLLILSPGLSFQGNNNYSAEVNLMYGKMMDGKPYFSTAYYGPRIGFEFQLFNKKHFIWATKIGWEGSLEFFTFRGNMISYIDKGNVDLRILPEIGFNYKNVINVLYGYNAPLLNYKIETNTIYKITLSIHLDFDLWRNI